MPDRFAPTDACSRTPGADRRAGLVETAPGTIGQGHVFEASSELQIEGADVDAARAAGVRRFIHVSSLSAREPALSDYGWSKAKSERIVAAYEKAAPKPAESRPLGRS